MRSELLIQNSKLSHSPLQLIQVVEGVMVLASKGTGFDSLAAGKDSKQVG